jgi:hypothetical protein
MVTAEDVAPCDAGANCTLSLHFSFGSSCAGQFVTLAGNPNTCGLVAGTVIIGFPKTIGDPFLAGLLSVSVTLLTFPTFTLPKFFADGVTFSDSGTLVGVDVGVGVAVEVRVAVGVGVAVGDAVEVCVAVAVAVDARVGVAVDVRVGVAVEVRVAVGVGVGAVVANAITRFRTLTVPIPVAKFHPTVAGYAG